MSSRVDPDMAMDLRGVLRGECSECVCTQFVRPQTGAACANCHHVPARHKKLTKTAPISSSSTLSASAVNSQAQLPQKLSSEKNYSRRPLYSQATSSTDTGPSYSHNTQYELSTSSSATHSAARSTYSCQADGCNNPVHFDPQLGYFSYCSARCRDVHILPGYNEKLKADISAFEDNLLTANKVKKTDLIREVVIKTKPRELVGLTFAQLGNTKTVISGFQLCKTEKYLKDGQIMLLDCLFEICENQVTSRITVSEIEDIIRPRTIISMRLDGTYAVETDLGDFLKTANKHGATHIFALWPLDNSDSYGLTVKQNAKKLDVETVSKDTSARLCGIIYGDQIVCYSSYSNKHLLEICTAKGSDRDRFHKDLENAAQRDMILILAVVRQ